MNMTTALLCKVKLLPSFLARVDPELCTRFANSTELVRDHRLDPYLAALHARVSQLRHWPGGGVQRSTVEGVCMCVCFFFFLKT
jgi:hypothetical protein